jgi:hypothetical protein
MFPAPDETIVRRSREIIAESWEVLRASAAVLRDLGYPLHCTAEKKEQPGSLPDDETSALS